MKNTTKPKISVVMPVYNASAYLNLAIDSILSQTFEEFELIIVDDKSTDSSYEIITHYAQRDPRIHIYRNSENSGVSYTANKAIRHANTAIIARMDADDVSHPTRLALQYDFLLANQETVAVGTHVNLIDENGIKTGEKKFPTKHDEISKKIFLMSPLQQPSIMINRARLPEDFSWYDANLSTAEDIDLFFKLMQHGKLANLDEILLDYRTHGKNLSNRDPKRTFELTDRVRREAIKRYKIDVPIRERILMKIQKLVVRLIPRKLLYRVFFLIRNLL